MDTDFFRRIGGIRFFVIFAGMKRLRWIWILVGAAILAACTSRTEQVPELAVAERSRSSEGPSGLVATSSPALSSIDSLMWQRPDSALMCLLPYFDTACRDAVHTVSTASDWHYANLLLAELLYKNDNPQLNRTDLLQAVNYYDSLCCCRNAARHVSTDPTLIFLDARAHYINGVGYYEHDSVVEACEEYLKALEVMENHFKDHDLIGKRARFMALTYGRLGEMFSEQLLAEHAIDCYKQALLYCKREPTSIYGTPVLLYNLGIQYDVANQKDSAAFYYEEALVQMPDNNNFHYRDIMSSKALFDYYNGLCPDSAIKDLKHIVALSVDGTEKTTRLLTLGIVLFDAKQYDSSQFYLETVFESAKDLQSKILAAEKLCNIYQTLGDSVKVLQYSSFLGDYTIREIEKKKDVSKITELFKNYLTQKQEMKAETERKKSINRILKTIIPIVVVVAMTIIVLSKIRSNKLLKEQQTKAERAFGETEQQHAEELRKRDRRHAEALEAERQTHRMERAAISSRLKRSNQELREMKDLMRQQSDQDSAKQEKPAASFMEEPICRLIIDRVNEGQFKSKIDHVFYKDYALEKQQLLDLRVAVDRHFGQFTVRLKKTFPELTNGDLDYCCLYLLGLTDADIAALMQRTYNTVYERNGKIRKILDCEGPLPITLKGMVNGSLSLSID